MRLTLDGVRKEYADTVALDDPPLDQAARDLSEYGYSDLKIRATFGDQQDAV